MTALQTLDASRQETGGPAAPLSLEVHLRPRLTPRQRACVVLVALGNSDEGIASALGISKLTAHKHIEAAKRRYGVSTRVRLVVEALFAHEISFAAVFAAADQKR